MIRPDISEAAPYYFTYINQVADGDIREILRRQLTEATQLLRSISDAKSRSRYAADKWSIREVLGHINDTERLFVFRAFWFARGFDTELPSFDQHVAMSTTNADDRPWNGLIDEFQSIRTATLPFFENLSAAAWDRRGIASGNPFTVRALAYLAAGHVTHHISILRDRYDL